MYLHSQHRALASSIKEAPLPVEMRVGRTSIESSATVMLLLPTRYTAHHYLLPARSPRQHAVSAGRDQHREKCLAEHVKYLVRLIDSVRIGLGLVLKLG